MARIRASSATNNYQLVGRDSGGGDFTYNSSTGAWILAGINEAIDQNNDSYMVQMSAYASQINTVTAVPEPTTLTILLGSVGMFAGWNRFRHGSRSPCFG